MKRFNFLFSISLALFLLLGVGGVMMGDAAVAAPVSQPIFPNPQEAVTQAANWLITTHQNEDGGYASFSSGANIVPSDVGGTLDALLALSGSGVSVDASIEYLLQNMDVTAAYAGADGASCGKLVLGLVATGQNPRDFGGQDFVAILNGHLQEDGSYNAPHPFGQSLALSGLAAANEPVPAEAIAWLTNLQSADEGLDGSWDDGFGTLGNPDATAISAMALVAAGTPADDESITRAIDFLAAAQLETGGWEYGPGFGQNGNSTALVVQALGALGIDFSTADSPFVRDGITPLDALLAYQSETGAFQADFGDGPFDDFLTTVQAVPAVAAAAAPVPVLISEPVEEPTAAPMEEPTDVPIEEPTNEPMEEPTAVPVEEPTAVSSTPLSTGPEPTDAPPVEEASEISVEPVAAPTPEEATSGSATPIILVVIALLAAAGGAYWYMKR